MSWISSQVLVVSVSVLNGPVSTQWRFVNANLTARLFLGSIGRTCRASTTFEVLQKKSL